MTNDQDNLFEDPALRKAAMQAWAGDRAPATLADRIKLAMSQVQTDGTEPLTEVLPGDVKSAGSTMRLVTDGLDDPAGINSSIDISPVGNGAKENITAGPIPSDDGMSSSLSREKKPSGVDDQRVSSPRYFQLFASLAAAAAVVSLAVMLIHPLLSREGSGGTPIAKVPGNNGGNNGPGDGPGVMNVVKLPSDLAKQILQLHDFCSSRENHHSLIAPRNDFNAMRDELATAAKGPAWVFDLTNQGWRFHGAERCPLGDQRISHLVFDREDNHVELSIMTIPLKPEWHMAEGMQISEQVDPSHWVVAFVSEGQMFTLVESGPAGEVSLASLELMRDQYRPLALSPVPAGISSHARVGLKSQPDPFVIGRQPNYTQRPNEHVDANAVGGPGWVLWGAGPVWRG